MRRVALLLFVFVIGLSFVHCHAADSANEKKVIVQKKNGGFRLGVVVANLNEDFLREHHLDGGVMVLSVFHDSPADEAGIEKHDIIVGFDGRNIEEPEDLAEMVEKIKEEKTATVVVNRDGKEKSFKVHLKKDDDNVKKQITINVDDEDIDMLVTDALRLPHILRQFRRPDFPTRKGGYLGVRGTDLSDQLKEYFEVEHGILVEEVVENSPAEKAGIKAGDVIYQINDRKIEDFNDLIRTLNYFNPDEHITVYYVRKGKKAHVQVVLGKKEGPDFEPIRMPHRPKEVEYFFKNFPGANHFKHFKKKMPNLGEDLDIIAL